MNILLRRFTFARSLDRSLTVQSPPVQIRDVRNELTFTVFADMHATYRIVDSRKFAHHYRDCESFEAVFRECLRVSGSTVLGDVLSGKDRSSFARESLSIGRLVIDLLKPFASEVGIVVFTCSCIPVVQESAMLDEIEVTKVLKKDIGEGALIGTILSQAGAGALSGMSPVINAVLGRAINPTPKNSSHKDDALV